MSDSSPPPSNAEADQLVALFQGRELELLSMLSAQLSVLKNQSSMLMGLAGLTVTVTGFSGHLLVKAGPAAWVPMVLGIVAVLLSVVVTLRVMLKVRWVTEDLSEFEQSVRTTIEHRDRQQRGLSVAGVFVALGLLGYLLAVVVAALRNGGAIA